MLGNVNSGRSVGVGMPDAPRQKASGQPGTVLNLARVETLASEFVNANGEVEVELLHRIGGAWYRAPNGANYARTLLPLGADSKFAKNLEERYISESTKNNVPQKDEVDVIGGEG